MLTCHHVIAELLIKREIDPFWMCIYSKINNLATDTSSIAPHFSTLSLIIFLQAPGTEWLGVLFTTQLFVKGDSECRQ